MTRSPLSRALLLVALLAPASPAAAAFVTFETGQVRPLALSPNESRLFAVNTPDNRLEIFDVTGGGLLHLDSVPVGLEPIAVAARTNGEVWVVNHLSDSVSIVDVASSPPRVVRTLLVGDEPRDIVFGAPVSGAPTRAFITTAHRGQNSGVPLADLTQEGIGRADVWVFNALNLGSSLGGTPLTKITLFGDTPRALAVSPDGNTVYAAVFHSGNQTTAINEGAVCNGGAGAPACGLDGVTMPGGLPGGQVPGGLPTPSPFNCAGATQPETGLIVRFDPTAGPFGTWEDQLGRNWNNAIRFSLPDQDVFAIDADAPTPVATGTPWAHVGTILFNMVANPVSGKVYVSNTEARNEVRFEGPGACSTTVRGHLHEARITVLEGATVAPRHLNKHLTMAASYPNPGAAAKAKSLATPLGMAVTGDGATLYVAAFGSSRVGVFSTAALESNGFVPNAADHITVSGGGPSGLVLREDPIDPDRLYVFTRFDNSISVIDTATEQQIDHQPVYNPEPAIVRDGRPVLYDAVATSSNGEAACAACHVFGDFDSLAWDLGNPNDATLNNPNPFRTPPGPVIDPDFRPLKGPMTTQSLRGMANHGPMHWRGDRTGGNDNPTLALDENAAFLKFIVAFDGLLGRGAPEPPVPVAEMEKFADFILQVTYPPNPIRALNNSLTSGQNAGRNFFLNPMSDIAQPCNGCHVLNPAAGFFGSDGLSSFENEDQDFKVPHLRNMYQKVGMFGFSSSPFVNAGNNGDQGPQVRGFGFLHDGAVDTILRFHNATVFNQNSPFGSNPGGFPNGAAGDPLRRQVEQFMLAFDSNLAPIVGQQITLTSTNAGTVGPRIDLLIARAAANECELVVKGTLGGQQRGWLRQANGTFKSDLGSETHTDAQLRAQATTAGQERTYTCVPPGSGQRIGINRDEDACLDADDGAPTDPSTCSVSGTTTTSTTISSTTTTTIPGSCTNVPVVDSRASVRVRARDDAGRLRARMVIDLAGYAAEPVTVSLADLDTPVIASQGVGALPPSGSSGKGWQFRTLADGVYRVTLRNLAPSQPGKFKLSVSARRWFTAAAANQSAADTSLTVQIGGLCFSHDATRKID